MTNSRSLMMIFILCAISLRAAPPNAEPFTMNGWQLHEYDMPKTREAIARARDYNVNFVIFTHHLFESVEGFLASGDNYSPEATPRRPELARLYRSDDRHTRPNPHWWADLRELGRLCDERQLPWYLWIHELDYLPPRFLEEGVANLDHPELRAHLTDRYERLLEVLPGTAGFVLTLHETQYKVFRNADVRSKRTVPERIVYLTEIIHAIARRHNKALILRNFFYEPKEMEYFREALGRLPDDIVVMSKDMCHEFHPFYPYDPMHGDVGKKRQIIEIELAVQKAWSSHGAYAQAEFIQRVVRRAQSKGLAGLVGHCRLLWDKPFQDSREVNLYAFKRFMQDPGLSVSAVLEDWARARYPAAPQAAPHLASALGRTQFINHNGRYHLENWFTKSMGDRWDDYPYYFGHLFSRSRYKWSQDPADKELEARLADPDAATYQRLVGEKLEVLRQVHASLRDLELAGRYLTAEEMAPLKEDFRFLLDAAMLQKEWVRAYFSMRMFTAEPRDAYRLEMEDALARLKLLDKTPGVTYGLDVSTGSRYNIDRFVLEMQWRIVNRARARAEDATIVAKLRKAAYVEGR